MPPYIIKEKLEDIVKNHKALINYFSSETFVCTCNPSLGFTCFNCRLSSFFSKLKEAISEPVEDIITEIEQPKIIEDCKFVKNNQCITTTSGIDPVNNVDCPVANNQKINGQYKDYWVLSKKEIEKGYVEPFRKSYKHLPCGSFTTMGDKLSETYAVNPLFYGSTFCSACLDHFPLSEFHWRDTNQVVGTFSCPKVSITVNDKKVEVFPVVRVFDIKYIPDNSDYKDVVCRKDEIFSKDSDFIRVKDGDVFTVIKKN